MNATSDRPTPPQISRDHNGISTDVQVRCSPDDVETLRLAFSTYGFLIARNEAMSLGAFAERIARHYDASLPRNAAVIAALQRAHKLNDTARVGSPEPAQA